MSLSILPEEIIREIFSRLGDYKSIISSTRTVCKSFLRITKSLRLEEEMYSSVYEILPTKNEMREMMRKRLGFSILFRDTIIDRESKSVDGKSIFTYNGEIDKSNNFFFENHILYNSDVGSLEYTLDRINGMFEISDEGMSSLYLLRTGIESCRKIVRKYIIFKGEVPMSGVDSVRMHFNESIFSVNNTNKVILLNFYFVPENLDSSIPLAFEFHAYCGDEIHITKIFFTCDDLTLLDDLYRSLSVNIKLGDEVSISVSLYLLVF